MLRYIPLLLVPFVLVSAPPSGAHGETPSLPNGEVRLALDRYQELLRSAQEVTSVAWARGTVALEVVGAPSPSVVVTVAAEVQTTASGATRVPLLPADVVLQSAEVDGGDAVLVRRDGMHSIWLDGGPRRASITATYRVAVTVGAATAAVVPLPPLPSSLLTVQRNGVVGPIEVTPSQGTDPLAGELRGELPSTAAVVVRWGDALGGAHVRRVALVVDVEPSGDNVRLRGTWDVEVVGGVGEVVVAREGEALVALSDSRGALRTVLRDGALVALLRGEGTHALQTEVRALVDRSEGQPKFALEAPASIASLTFVVSGQREVTFEPDVPHAVDVRGEGDTAVTTATADLPAASSVAVAWTETRQAPESAERFNVETYQIVRMAEGAVRSEVHLRYEVIRDGLREVFVEVPDDVVVYRVEGPYIEDWRTFAAEEEAPRRVRVAFGQEVTQSFELELELEKVTGQTEGTSLSLPVVRAIGAFRETGVVALIDGDKVGFAPAKAEGYTKVGQDALPVDIRQELTDTVAQAFKHIGRAGALSSEVAAATQKEVRFDARVMALYTIKDGAMLANASVQVEVKSGRTDALLLDLPVGVSVLTLTAPSLNKSEPATDVEAPEGRSLHRVRFTQALEGAIQLDVELEQLLPKELGSISVPDVRVSGAEVQEGSFGITAETGIEVQPKEATDLRRVDAEELPKSVRLRSDREILLGYHYAHVPWALGLQVKRLQTVQTLAAVASPVWLETTALADGHVTTRAVYQVANADRQFLRLALPEGANVWTVSAGALPVKAVRDEDGALAIPLPKAATTLVEVIYDQKGEPFGFAGSLELQPPRADLLATNVQWRVRMPQTVSPWTVETALERKQEWDYAGPPDTGSDGKLPIAVPAAGELQTLVFAAAVADPTEPAPTVAVQYVGRPDPAWGVWLALLAVAGLALATWRRARGPFGGVGSLGLVVGILAGAVYAVGWGVSLEEGIGAVVALVVVGATSAWLRRRAKGDE